MSSIQTAHQFSDHLFDALKIGLTVNRETLYAQIDRRVEDMIAAGLVDEVKGLLNRGYRLPNQGHAIHRLSAHHFISRRKAFKG